MRILTADELRFSIQFAVRQLEPALRRQLVDKNDLRRRLAEQTVVDRLVERFDRHEVYAPDPVRPPSG